MNKRIYIPTAILLVALLVSGCGFQIVTGSGKVVTETREVSNFSRITLAGIGDLYVTQGENVSIRIEAEDNLIPYFDTAVQGNTLTIRIKNEYMGIDLHPTKPVKFHVTTPKIKALTLAGSGNILASNVQATDFNISLLGSGNISTESLTATNVGIRLAGSGDIKLGSLHADDVSMTLAGSGNFSVQELTATTVGVSIAGSGDVRLDKLTAKKFTSTSAGSGGVSAAGEVTEQHIETLGSGDYTADQLKSQTATIKVSGSGNSRVWATDSLDVTILGSGDVAYSGTPGVNANIGGSGRVNRTIQP